MKIKILIIFAITLLPDCWGQAFKNIGKEQAMTDLQIIRKSVEEIHPGLNRFGQQAGFVSRYDSICRILSRYDTINNLEFFRLVNPLMTSIKCGHVKFLPPVKDFPFYYYQDNLLPFIVRFDGENRLFIVEAQNDLLRGKYLEKINGQPILDILKILRGNMFVDGNVQTSANAQIQQYFSAWYADFIQNSTNLDVVLSDNSGSIKQLNVTGISIAAWQQINKRIGFLGKQNELSFVNDSTAFLRIASFMPETSNRDFLKFLSKSFKNITQKNIENLIIDVRGNEGGNDKLGKELYSYIARNNFKYYERIELRVNRKKNITFHKLAYFPRFIGIASLLVRKRKDGSLLWVRHQNLGNHRPKKNAYKGMVTFLEDGLSFSVTSEFLAIAKTEKRGKFVGEESGGSYSGDNSGAFVIVKLPASGIDVGIPIAGYYSAVKDDAQFSRGILPDTEVKPTASDLLENRDTVLNFILKN